MKRIAYLTEIVKYRVEFEAPADADDDTLDELAREEFELFPGRKPVDYEIDSVTIIARS